MTLESIQGMHKQLSAYGIIGRQIQWLYSIQEVPMHKYIDHIEW